MSFVSIYTKELPNLPHLQPRYTIYSVGREKLNITKKVWFVNHYITTTYGRPSRRFKAPLYTGGPTICQFPKKCVDKPSRETFLETCA